MREGAISLWPGASNDLSLRLLEALSQATGLPLDVPYQDLSPRQRRIILHGAGEEWIEIPGGKRGPTVKFQYKGLYPALAEAARLSPGFRSRLETFVGEVACTACDGDRLRPDAAAVRFREHTIGQINRLPLKALCEEVLSWQLDPREQKIAGEILRELQNRVGFLLDVGLEYLTLGRTAATLSGGEAQRIRLASQVGSGLCGVMYVLDEPTIGLHPRDNTRLLGALHKLRDLGNTLLVVEHDKEVVESADCLIDFGPRAGEHGGRVVAQGAPADVARAKDSVTGPYLSRRKGDTHSQQSSPGRAGGQRNEKEGDQEKDRQEENRT